MKRMLLASLTSFSILSGFAACGKAPMVCDADNLTEAAQLCSDRDSLGFAREFGSGTFIGAAPQDSLLIRNGGLADLSISSATLTGDSAFTLTTEPASLPATVKGNKYFYMRVVFAPTQAKLYTAKISVQSNAANFPSKDFELTGCGVPTNGGTSPCFGGGADAGP